MTLNLKNIVDLTTPQYLLISILSPIAAYMITNATAPDYTIIPIIISLSLAVLWFNTNNMIFDFELDKLSKPLRPLPMKKVSISEANYLSTFFILCSGIIAILTNTYFFALIVLFFIIGYIYNSNLIHTKKFFWGSSFTGAILYGLIPFLSIIIISDAEIPLVFLIFFTFLFLVISNSKDFEDFEDEKKFRIKSLQSIFGIETSKKIIIYSIALAIIIMLFASLGGIIDIKFLPATFISGLVFVLSARLFSKEVDKIKYKQTIMKTFIKPELKDIVTQSNAVTDIVLCVLTIEIIYGLIAII
jgi:4-hydroxybenzoate polyprenyltransferase